VPPFFVDDDDATSQSRSLPMSADVRMSRVLADLRSEPAVPVLETPAKSLASRMAHCRTPGASIAVIDDFDVAWAGGFGVRRIDGADDVTAHTPFQAGSISKPVFALAVMRLVERGVVDLDADVNQYLTSWQVPANGDWRPRITLRQLLSHTAGTTVHGFPGYPASGPLPSLPQVLDGVPPANTLPVIVDTLPGLAFRYSGGGTTIAQLAVVDAMKQSFPDLMRELILDPVGMADSTYEQPPSAEVAACAAESHPWNDVRIAGGWHVYPEMAAAGLWTTAGDLARLAVALMRTLRGEPSMLPLKPETVASMLRPQLPDQKAGQDFVGLGWFCYGKDDDFWFGHQGGNAGFLAEMKLFPARGKGAVAMINSIQGWPLPREILKAIEREYGWPAVAKPSVAMLEGAAYAGTYRNDDGFAFVVAPTTEALSLQFRDGPSILISPISDTEFQAKAVNLTVRFERSPDGGVAAMTVVQGGKAIRVTRHYG
jgi:CubicO group peptidase (beta-lactamase class C family)